MSEVVPLLAMGTFTPTIYAMQWNGRHATAMAFAAAVGVALDEIGADVIRANYRAEASNHDSGGSSPTLSFEIAREDDGSAWAADLHGYDWLAIWVLDGRLVAVDVYDDRDGTDRFVRVAPVITLRPTLGQ